MCSSDRTSVYRLLACGLWSGGTQSRVCLFVYSRSRGARDGKTPILIKQSGQRLGMCKLVVLHIVRGNGIKNWELSRKSTKAQCWLMAGSLVKNTVKPKKQGARVPNTPLAGSGSWVNKHPFSQERLSVCPCVHEMKYHILEFFINKSDR